MVVSGPAALRQQIDPLAMCRQQTFGLTAEECGICAGPVESARAAWR
jgi:hypothetical protein